VLVNVICNAHINGLNASNIGFRHKMVLYLDGSYLGGHLWTR
jgi:hypothetical protein